MGEVLFGADSRLRIPRYQRPYTWETDEITQFWLDLGESDETYFLGSIILNDETRETTQCLEIIDGQQRLLTVTILSAVLRDIASGIDSEAESRFQSQDIEIITRRGGTEAFRIVPGDSCRDFFQKYIQERGNKILKSKPRTKEEKRIKRAYSLFHEKVSDGIEPDWDASQVIDHLEALREKLSELVVISIHVSDEDAAYDIFETTNATGVDLSISDLLKNRILKALRPDQDRDKAKETWQELTQDIEASGAEIRRFIRHFWLSRYAFVSEKKLFKSLKETAPDWSCLLDELRVNAQLYKVLLSGGAGDFAAFPQGDKIHKSLFALRIMGVAQCHVFFLSLLRNHASLDTDPSRLFELIEKFSFQYSVVCRQPGNSVERLYSRFARKLEEVVSTSSDKHRTKNVQRTLSELETELLSLLPPEELFLERFTELTYAPKLSRRIKYILDRIDSHLTETDEKRVDFDTVSIEHILPQNPDGAWGLSEKDIEEHVHKIGNLTLLGKKLNSPAQNKTVDLKMKHYSKTDLQITQRLVEELTANGCKWDIGEIDSRGRRLAQMAYEDVWHLERP